MVAKGRWEALVGPPRRPDTNGVGSVVKIKGIDNLDLLVSDVAKTVDFYHGVLGLELSLPYTPGDDSAVIDTGNVSIFIFKAGEGEHAPRRRPALIPDNPPGFDAIAFQVDDLDEAMAELGDRVEWATEKPFEWNDPGGSWSLFRPMYDPEGNMVYLTQMHRVPTDV